MLGCQDQGPSRNYKQTIECLLAMINSTNVSASEPAPVHSGRTLQAGWSPGKVGFPLYMCSLQGLSHGSLQVLWFGIRDYNSSEKDYLSSACPFWLVYFFSAVKLAHSFFGGSILRTTCPVGYADLTVLLTWAWLPMGSPFCLSSLKNLTTNLFSFTLFRAWRVRGQRKLCCWSSLFRFLLWSQYNTTIGIYCLVVYGVWVWIFWFLWLSFLFRNRLLYKIEREWWTQKIYSVG